MPVDLCSLTPLLDKIKAIEDLRLFPSTDLGALAKELREETIRLVSSTGGHLGAGLGVVELTVALHYVFNTPSDRLIWDVGHQSYPHKILTDRRAEMHSLRQGGGISGFTKRSESIFDPFGTGHSSTSISAALGMAMARDALQKQHDIIAVIGDGAMSAGMAYEAMNNAGALRSRMLVVLNDNNMSISPPVGAMSDYLSRLISSKTYLETRNFAKNMMQHLPSSVEKFAKRAEQCAKAMTGIENNFFEEMGFYYIGPVDGHNIEHLVPILENIRNNYKTQHRPVLLHVVTEKGKGFLSPDASFDKYHAVQKFNIETKVQEKVKASSLTYTHVFSKALVAEAKEDKTIVAITAAMPTGTGLDVFSKAFPDRMFDVGIAEQHAVTFAAGLACENMKPFVAIYSTFLQRAYDQIIHDVVIQKLPVRFAIDRAGLVGGDGPTHAGAYDIAYLMCLPDVIIMAPSDEIELMHMVATAVSYNEGPSFIRYPRGEGRGHILPERGDILKIGKARIMQEGKDIAILSLGTRLHEAQKAVGICEKEGICITLIDARFAKPFDEDMVLSVVENHKALLIVEEGSKGGFGAHILQFLAQKNKLHLCVIKSLCFPDVFIEQNSPYAMYEEAGVNTSAIIQTIRDILLR